MDLLQTALADMLLVDIAGRYINYCTALPTLLSET